MLNVNLLNTAWHLKTLRQYHPDLPWTLDDEAIDALGVVHWATESVTVAADPPRGDSLTLIVEPVYAGTYLLVQDQVLLDIVRENRWRRPMCFSAGFGESLRLGLTEYGRLDGLIWLVVTDADARGDLAVLENNLFHRYDFSGYGDRPFIDRTARSTSAIYHAAFARLARGYSERDEDAKLAAIRARYDELWPWAGGLESGFGDAE